MGTRLLLIAFILPICIAAQDNIKKERDEFKLQVAVNETNSYEKQMPKSKYLIDSNILQLYPGESIFLELQSDNGIIRTVNENRNPNKTIEISFVQIVKDDRHNYMLLKISNPFDLVLQYSADIFL